MQGLDALALAEVRAAFRPEAAELHERIGAALLTLDEAQGDAPDAVSEARGALHTLKGAAAAAGLDGLRVLTHAMEEVLRGDLKDGAVRSYLFDGTGLVGAFLEQAFQGGVPVESDLLAFLQRSPVPLGEDLLGKAEEVRARATEEAEATEAHRRQVANDAREPPESPPEELSSAPAEEVEEDRVRVSGQALDDLLGNFTELFVTAGELDGVARELLQDAGTRHLGLRVSGTLEELRRRITACQEGARSLRMVPARTLLIPLRLAARHVADQGGKRIVFRMEGEGVRLDRRLVEEARTIFLHLVRNAVDHGLEEPDERRSAGKDIEGQVTVRFELQAGVVVAEVRDDGRGIDSEILVRRAVEKGFITEDRAARMEETERFELLFHEGFSTRDQVTEVSGRGVGLAEVRQRTHALGGVLFVTSTLGQGSTFRLEVPLATTTIAALFVRIGNQVHAIPLAAVERVLPDDEADEAEVFGVPCLDLGDERLSVVDLRRVLAGRTQVRESTRRAFLILSSGRHRAAFLVDEVLEQREVVVRPLGEYFRAYDLLVGATLLGDGEVTMILSPPALLKFVAPEPVSSIEEGAGPGAQILVVDDSFTMLAMLSALLEGAGYRVEQANDGAHGLERLRKLGAERVSMVLTDIDMPRMDGLAFTRAIREDPELAGVPVVILTANDDLETQRAGMEAGADAFLVKGRIDRPNLMAAVERLL